MDKAAFGALDIYREIDEKILNHRLSFGIEEQVSADKRQGNHNRDKALIFELQADFGYHPAQNARQSQNENRN